MMPGWYSILVRNANVCKQPQSKPCKIALLVHPHPALQKCISVQAQLVKHVQRARYGAARALSSNEYPQFQKGKKAWQ